MDFLLREDLRPVRFQLELLKPEVMLDEAGIESTFVFYGSARIPEPDKADALIETAATDYQRLVAERLKAKSKYYDEARRLARMVSRIEPAADGKRHFVVCSGGGPSIMEAATRARNRSASTSCSSTSRCRIPTSRPR
jgi:predicted Rossmann-fold nucleotide-binding protein